MSRKARSSGVNLSQPSHPSTSSQQPKSQRAAQSQLQPQPLSRSTTIKFVKYVLNNCLSKIPIKRVDIVKNVLSDKTKMFPAYLLEAQNILEDVYGFKLVQVPNKAQNQYVCVSILEPITELQQTPSQQRHVTLLFLVLSFIFMNGGSVCEATIRDFLKKLGICLDEPHDFFGNVSKLLTDTYPKQQYLIREKRVLEGSNEEEIMVSWGFRSTLEFPKKKVLDLVAEILEKPAICFGQQYEEVNREEGNRMEVE